jgi:2-keto-3-deoxy-L-rhamnonate aldolase RhmA
MKNNKTQIGTIISMNLAQVACQLPALGYDFIFIDLEHGSVNDETIATIILSKKPECKVFIRIRNITEASIKHALDIGCDGIIAPRVEHMSEIETLVTYALYPPAGKRSVGFGLANQYGLGFKDYTDRFRPIILPQVESVEGVEIAAQILSAAPIAGIFVGPYDLSMSLGIPGQFDSSVFQDTYESLRQICITHDKLFCTFTSNMQHAKEELAKGTDMLAVGVDANLFLNQYKGMIDALKRDEVDAL